VSANLVFTFTDERIPAWKAKKKTKTKTIASEELLHSVYLLAAKSKALSTKIMPSKQAYLFSMLVPVCCLSVLKIV